MAISLSDVAVPKAYAPGTPPSTHAHTHCPAHLLPALPTCPLSHSCYTPGPDALLEPAAPMRNLTSYYLVLSSYLPAAATPNLLTAFPRLACFLLCCTASLLHSIIEPTQWLQHPPQSLNRQDSFGRGGRRNTPPAVKYDGKNDEI